MFLVAADAACGQRVTTAKTSSSRAGHGTDERHEFPSLRTFSVPARGSFHESKNRDRKRTRQIEENPTAEVRELRTKHPRKRRATKIRFENANVCNAPGARLNARAGANCVIAFLLPCPLLAVLGVNSSKRDAGMRLGVSGASRCYF